MCVYVNRTRAASAFRLLRAEAWVAGYVATITIDRRFRMLHLVFCISYLRVNLGGQILSCAELPDRS
jgi:hypothetical protein